MSDKLKPGEFVQLPNGWSYQYIRGTWELVTPLGHKVWRGEGFQEFADSITTQPTPTSNAGDVRSDDEITEGAMRFLDSHMAQIKRMGKAEADLAKATKIIERFEMAGTALLFKSTPALMTKDTGLVPNRNLKSLGEAIREAKAFMGQNINKENQDG